MSLLFYLFSYLFSDDDESSVITMKIPQFNECDHVPKTSVYWDEMCSVLSVDDLNLFDESTTPPLQMYTGKIKPILKRKSSELFTEESQSF